MSDRVFLDTNVLVYAYDGRDPARQQNAIKLIDSVAGANAVVSTQVLAEFCNVMLSGRGVSMKPADLGVVLEEVLGPMVAHAPDSAFYMRAIRLHEANSLSIYDSLIVQAAIDLECDTLYSEDIQSGRTFGSVVVVNPFKTS